MDILNFSVEQFQVFLLVFVRISAMVTIAPIFGSRQIPVQAKAGISFLFAILIFPLLGQANFTLPTHNIELIILILREAIVGLTIGFISILTFTIVQLSGQLEDTQVGFGMVNIMDPQFGVSLPILGSFKYLLATIFFLMVNGHHLLVAALFSSYKIIPLATFTFAGKSLEAVTKIFTEVFLLAIVISLPILGVTFLTEVAFGILTKLVPQINVFSIGIPVKIEVALFTMIFTMPIFVVALKVIFERMNTNLLLFMQTLH